jgi:hypothetical protein
MKARLTHFDLRGTICACNESGWMKLGVLVQGVDYFSTRTKPNDKDIIILPFSCSPASHKESGSR